MPSSKPNGDKPAESPDIQAVLSQLTELQETQNKLMAALLATKSELDATKQELAATQSSLPNVIVQMMTPAIDQIKKANNETIQKVLAGGGGGGADVAGDGADKGGGPVPENLSIGQAIVWGLKYLVDNGESVAKAAEGLRGIFKPAAASVAVEREVADRLMMGLKVSRLVKQFGDTNMQIDQAQKVIDETLGVKR